MSDIPVINRMIYVYLRENVSENIAKQFLESVPKDEIAEETNDLASISEMVEYVHQNNPSFFPERYVRAFKRKKSQTSHQRSKKGKKEYDSGFSSKDASSSSSEEDVFLSCTDDDKVNDHKKESISQSRNGDCDLDSTSSEDGCSNENDSSSNDYGEDSASKKETDKSLNIETNKGKNEALGGSGESNCISRSNVETRRFHVNFIPKVSDSSRKVAKNISMPNIHNKITKFATDSSSSSSDGGSSDDEEKNEKKSESSFPNPTATEDSELSTQLENVPLPPNKIEDILPRSDNCIQTICNGIKISESQDDLLNGDCFQPAQEDTESDTVNNNIKSMSQAVGSKATVAITSNVADKYISNNLDSKHSLDDDASRNICNTNYNNEQNGIIPILSEDKDMAESSQNYSTFKIDEMEISLKLNNEEDINNLKNCIPNNNTSSTGHKSDVKVNVIKEVSKKKQARETSKDFIPRSIVHNKITKFATDSSSSDDGSSEDDEKSEKRHQPSSSKTSYIEYIELSKKHDNVHLTTNKIEDNLTSSDDGNQNISNGHRISLSQDGLLKGNFLKIAKEDTASDTKNSSMESVMLYGSKGSTMGSKTAVDIKLKLLDKHNSNDIDSKNFDDNGVNRNTGYNNEQKGIVPILSGDKDVIKPSQNYSIVEIDEIVVSSTPINSANNSNLENGVISNNTDNIDSKSDTKVNVIEKASKKKQVRQTSEDFGLSSDDTSDKGEKDLEQKPLSTAQVTLEAISEKANTLQNDEKNGFVLYNSKENDDDKERLALSSDQIISSVIQKQKSPESYESSNKDVSDYDISKSYDCTQNNIAQNKITKFNTDSSSSGDEKIVDENLDVTKQTLPSKSNDISANESLVHKNTLIFSADVIETDKPISNSINREEQKSLSSAHITSEGLSVKVAEKQNDEENASDYNISKSYDRTKNNIVQNKIIKFSSDLSSSGDEKNDDEKQEVAKDSSPLDSNDISANESLVNKNTLNVPTDVIKTNKPNSYSINNKNKNTREKIHREVENIASTIRSSDESSTEDESEAAKKHLESIIAKRKMNVNRKGSESTESDNSSDEEVIANKTKSMEHVNSTISFTSAIVEPESHYVPQVYLSSPTKIGNSINKRMNNNCMSEDEDSSSGDDELKQPTIAKLRKKKRKMNPTGSYSQPITFISKEKDSSSNDCTSNESDANLNFTSTKKDRNMNNMDPPNDSAPSEKVATENKDVSSSDDSSDDSDTMKISNAYKKDSNISLSSNSVRFSNAVGTKNDSSSSDDSTDESDAEEVSNSNKKDNDVALPSICIKSQKAHIGEEQNSSSDDSSSDESNAEIISNSKKKKNNMKLESNGNESKEVGTAKKDISSSDDSSSDESDAERVSNSIKKGNNMELQSNNIESEKVGHVEKDVSSSEYSSSDESDAERISDSIKRENDMEMQSNDIESKEIGPAKKNVSSSVDSSDGESDIEEMSNPNKNNFNTGLSSNRIQNKCVVNEEKDSPSNNDSTNESDVDELTNSNKKSKNIDLPSTGVLSKNADIPEKLESSSDDSSSSDSDAEQIPKCNKNEKDTKLPSKNAQLKKVITKKTHSSSSDDSSSGESDAEEITNSNKNDNKMESSSIDKQVKSVKEENNGSSSDDSTDASDAEEESYLDKKGSDMFIPTTGIQSQKNGIVDKEKSSSDYSSSDESDAEESSISKKKESYGELLSNSSQSKIVVTEKSDSSGTDDSSSDESNAEEASNSNMKNNDVDLPKSILQLEKVVTREKDSLTSDGSSSDESDADKLPNPNKTDNNMALPNNDIQLQEASIQEKDSSSSDDSSSDESDNEGVSDSFQKINNLNSSSNKIQSKKVDAERKGSSSNDESSFAELDDFEKSLSTNKGNDVNSPYISSQLKKSPISQKKQHTVSKNIPSDGLTAENMHESLKETTKTTNPNQNKSLLNQKYKSERVIPKPQIGKVNTHNSPKKWLPKYGRVATVENKIRHNQGKNDSTGKESKITHSFEGERSKQGLLQTPIRCRKCNQLGHVKRKCSNNSPVYNQRLKLSNQWKKKGKHSPNKGDTQEDSKKDKKDKKNNIFIDKASKNNKNDSKSRNNKRNFKNKAKKLFNNLKMKQKK